VARIADDEFADMPGQDSFLDVLTNMVGIIILLVVVTGLRTSQATVRAAVEKVKAAANAEQKAPKDQLPDAQRAALAAESNLKSTMRQVVEVHGETSLREHERDHLTSFIAAVEQELGERRSALSAEDQRDYDLRRRLAKSQRTLENLSREQIALLSQPAEELVEAIQNQPTPFARRSTGKEVLLHLSGGYLAVIPHELVDETLSDVHANLWRLRERDRFTRTVGPINGFRLRYLVGLVPVNLGARPDPSIPGSSQFSPPVRPELIWYEIIPEKSPLGEPVAKAIAPNSELRQVLREHPADTAVVVIAVFPDSIRELHDLKRELYAAGYATAEVPCIAGRPIKGSPRAPRSGQIFVQ
jgi:hypothetical protein